MCLGALVSWYFRDWTWLGRFGALVTITTMVFATFNADVEARLLVQYLNDYMEPSEEIYNRVRAQPYLYGIQLPLTEEQTRELVKKEVAAFNERARATLKDELTSALRTLELWVAIVGTVTWAFADLTNKLYSAASPK
jgi:hypothetical protein